MEGVKVTTTLAEYEQVIANKQLLLKCFIAEERLAKFLLERANLQSDGFSVEELATTKRLVRTIYSILQQIQPSDEGYHKDSSDDNVPLPYVR